jgi:hypothetical protein
MHSVTFDIDAEGVFDEFGTQNGGEARVKRVEEIAARGIGAKEGAPFAAAGDIAQGEADRRFGHGEALDDLGYRLKFGAVRAQELQPRGRGEEQVAQFDHRATGQGRRLDGPDPPPGDRYRRGLFAPIGR